MHDTTYIPQVAALFSRHAIHLSGLLMVPLRCSDIGWLRTAFAMLGKLTISGSFAHIYVYSAEIFPTVVRNVGVGAGSMNARIGGLVAPFVAELVSNPALSSTRTKANHPEPVQVSRQTSFIRTTWCPLKCDRIVKHADY